MLALFAPVGDSIADVRETVVGAIKYGPLWASISPGGVICRKRSHCHVVVSMKSFDIYPKASGEEEYRRILRITDHQGHGVRDDWRSSTFYASMP